MPVWTIGHSSAELDRLFALLREQHIDLLVDVRSSPYSKYVPQANREVLAAATGNAGVSYVFMGDSLGGKPKGRGPAGHEDNPDYARLAESDAFKRGISELVELTRAQRVCILCSEEDPAKCHRGNLISPTLVSLGTPVVHIRHDGTTESQQDMELRQSGGQLSLF